MSDCLREWQTIFSGSKRYIGKSGLVGDNTDVRPPADDEKWGGVIIAGRRGRGGNNLDLIRQVTLVLDGVFFLDGEFVVGPDDNKMFEQTAADAEAHRPDHLPRPPICAIRLSRGRISARQRCR